MKDIHHPLNDDSLEPLDIVNILNTNYWELTQDDTIVPFGYWTDGNIEEITYLEFPLWNSEADGYDYDYLEEIPEHHDTDSDELYIDEVREGEMVPLMRTVKALYAELYSRIVRANPAKLFNHA